jgi:hypothetical protein
LIYQVNKEENMQKNFHFYCVAVLARAAGFNPADALTIAYASQYTDNATESEPIRVAGDVNFDPVCTAYDKLEDLGRAVLSWSAQKRVYIPFHFIPPQRFNPSQNNSFSFVTKQDSKFANWLLNEAAREPLKNNKHRLCRIGIALHMFADTWAHKGFSGRLNRVENDIDGIKVFDPDTSQYQAVTLGEQILSNILPEIGHAEAGYFPDLSYAKWQYAYERQNTPPVLRDNVTDCLQAAEKIYDYLSQVKKQNPVPPIPWEALKTDFQRLFAYRPADSLGLKDLFSRAAYDAYHAFQENERCGLWRITFEHLFAPHALIYDKEDWRRQAFAGDTNWDSYTPQEWAQGPPITPRPDFWDSLWVHFHRAALRHRHLVLENLP